MTVRPRRSIVLALGPASLEISWLEPTATIRSPLTATACAIVNRSSTVTILPLEKTRSAAPEAWAGAAPPCARARPPKPFAKAERLPTARHTTTAAVAPFEMRRFIGLVSEVRLQSDGVHADHCGVVRSFGFRRIG